jgi:hypothetical protein
VTVPTSAPTTSTSSLNTIPPILLTVRGNGQPTTSSGSQASLAVTTQAATQNPIPPILPNGTVVNSSNPLTSAQANRYLSLAFGLIILIFLSRDSWTYLKEKGAHLDKKINNVALLILALIVVGLMYWL